MSSPENENSHTIAMTAVIRLRQNFQVVSKFVQDPQYAINRADMLRQEDERRHIKPVSGIIERHRAKTALRLGLLTSLSLQRALNQLAETVASFNSTNDADGDVLLAQVLDTGRKTEAWQAHIGNCLNVIKGTEKKILHPDGPAL